MSRPETVEVPVELLDKLAAFRSEGGALDGPTSVGARLDAAVALTDLLALRPWEPTEEQVEGYCIRRYEVPGLASRRIARDDLKAAAKVLGVDQ